MPRDRFFIPQDGVLGERVALPPDDARKLLIVLRRRSGDVVRVVDAAGASFMARLEIEAGQVHARLESQADAEPTESGARIVIAQAVPKGQKMDFIVEKATELGAAAIVPLLSERVIGDRTGDRKHERWQRIAKSAAAQSGRAIVPDVAPVTDWDALLSTFGEYQRVYIAWEGAPTIPLRERFEAEAAAAASILIAIGPEGGFSSAEVAAAEAAGAATIALGPRILRTETVALVVLTALLYARGEI